MHRINAQEVTVLGAGLMGTCIAGKHFISPYLQCFPYRSFEDRSFLNILNKKGKRILK